MSTTQERLDRYITAEQQILEAQEVRGDDTTHRMAELQEVRKAIKELQSQVARESSPRGLRHSLANFNR
ncbi:MAG: hypothetical protein AAGI72_23690 [Pseudomonadota bacterium]